MDWILSPESYLLWRAFTVISFLLIVWVLIFVPIKLRRLSEAPLDGKLLSAKATERLLKEVGVRVPD